MKRRLRIAVSVFFALVAVALCALWVRSYQVSDNLCFRTNAPAGAGQQQMIGVASNWGFFCNFSFSTVQKGAWHYWNQPAWERKFFLFEWGGGSLKIQYWLPVVIASSLAASPWIDWSKQFSLRTLLIATTLVAAVLGLAVWAGR